MAFFSTALSGGTQYNNSVNNRVYLDRVRLTNNQGGKLSTSEPSNVLEKQETLDELKTLIGDLPERSQLILSLYYVEELTLKEIADVISVSESRISQILTETATKLRTRLK